MIRIATRVLTIGVALAAASPLRAQSPATSAFVTTVGNDTISVEQYARDGNTVRGVWASRQGASSKFYYYEIILDAAGRPDRYSVLMRPAGSAAPAESLPSLSVQYGADSATLVAQGGTPMRKRIAMSGGYPKLGTSVVGLELALQRLRSTGVDASTIVLHSPLGPSFDPVKLPVLFVRPDSVRLTTELSAKLDSSGRLVRLHDANRETRRVPSIDVGAIVDEWSGASDASRDTARIDLSLAELQRFVGRYAVRPDLQVSVERVGSRLLLRSPDGSLELVPQTATTFKVSGEHATVEFERNSAGDVVAMTLVNGGTRQRAPRIK